MKKCMQISISQFKTIKILSYLLNSVTPSQMHLDVLSSERGFQKQELHSLQRQMSSMIVLPQTAIQKRYPQNYSFGWYYVNNLFKLFLYFL